MVKEPRVETAIGPVGWAQDQLYLVKGRVAQLEQQLEQLQSVSSTMTESMQALERSLRNATSGAAQVPRLQEELNQSIALIVQLQDQEAESRERLDSLAARGEAEQSQGKDEWTGVARRVEQLERQVMSWQDRQEGVADSGRRFQEALSRVERLLQQLEQRVEAVETKAASSLEGTNRAEHTLTQIEASVLDLQRENEATAERSKVAGDMALRLEGTLNDSMQELARLELLAERIELHRAERQRLEDRAQRLESEMGDLHSTADEQQERLVQISGQQQTVASRFDTLQELVTEQRTTLADQFRKLSAAETRTKRRQIQELEREIREMKQYAAGLTEE